MDFAADIPLIYTDFGVTVTVTPKGGGTPVTGLALHRHPGASVLAGDVIGTERTLRYPLATFPALKRGDTVQIGTATYAVREAPQALSRGLEAIVPLAEA